MLGRYFTRQRTTTAPFPWGISCRQYASKKSKTLSSTSSISESGANSISGANPTTITIRPTTTTTSLPIIPPGSQHHSSLSTFLAHAARTSLSPTSPLYVGTLYEYTVQASLARLGFHLTRTGRASDLGIDLLGTWHLPLPTTTTTVAGAGAGAPPPPPPPPKQQEQLSPPQPPVRVLLQCKAHARRSLTPEHVRELEGAFTGAPAGWRIPDVGGRGGDCGNRMAAGTFGFLVGLREASRGVREALARSSFPVGYVMVDGEGKVEQFLWNWVAGQGGLEGLGVTMRYSSHRGEGNDEDRVKVRREIALTWKGRLVGNDGVVEDAPAQGHIQEILEVPIPKKPRRSRKTKATTAPDYELNEAKEAAEVESTSSQNTKSASG